MLSLSSSGPSMCVESIAAVRHAHCHASVQLYAVAHREYSAMPVSSELDFYRCSDWCKSGLSESEEHAHSYCSRKGTLES